MSTSGDLLSAVGLYEGCVPNIIESIDLQTTYVVKKLCQYRPLKQGRCTSYWYSIIYATTEC